MVVFASRTFSQNFVLVSIRDLGVNHWLRSHFYLISFGKGIIYMFLILDLLRSYRAENHFTYFFFVIYFSWFLLILKFWWLRYLGHDLYKSLSQDANRVKQVQLKSKVILKISRTIFSISGPKSSKVEWRSSSHVQKLMFLTLKNTENRNSRRNNR